MARDRLLEKINIRRICTLIAAVLLTVYCITIHKKGKLDTFFGDTSFAGGHEIENEHIITVHKTDVKLYFKIDVNVNNGFFALKLCDENGKVYTDIKAEKGQWINDKIIVGRLEPGDYRLVIIAAAGEDDRADTVYECSVYSETYGINIIKDYVKTVLDFLGITDYKTR